MVSIPGSAYLLIGALTIGISYFINQKTNTNSLTLFMFIGAIFATIGLIKLAIGRTPKKTNHTAHKHTGQAQHAHKNRQEGQTRPSQQKNPIQTTERTAAENPPTDFIPINPRNRVEQYILEQEVREEKVKAHPPIITCSKCGRRQYKIREHCFVCNHRL